MKSVLSSMRWTLAEEMMQGTLDRAAGFFRCFIVLILLITMQYMVRSQSVDHIGLANYSGLCGLYELVGWWCSYLH